MTKTNDPRMNSLKDWLPNLVGLIGTYGVTLADFTGAVILPTWVGVISALAGASLTFSLVAIRIAEARGKMAEARRKEIENEKLEHGTGRNTHEHKTTK